MNADLIHPADLDTADRAAWVAMTVATPAFASPLLGPDFAEAVGAVRDDARVAVWREDGAPVAFLAHHARPMAFARPIGAPFCDYHALIRRADAPFAAPDALCLAGVSALRLSGAVDPFGDFADVGEVEAGRRIVLDGPATAYFERLKAQSANRHKNFRRYSRKLEADVGPMRIAAPDRDQAAFDRLIGWKREQIRRTGVHDFLHMPWAQALMQRLFDSRTAPFEGLMVSLYAGERLVAAHFGVRLGDYFHPWIGSSDPDLDAYSPGLLHLWSAVEAMPALALRTYDLGPSFDHWKQMFANDAVPVRRGLAPAASFAGRRAAACEGVWTLPVIKRVDAAARLRNRLDQIAAMELTLGGRVQGVIGALAGYDKRRASRPSPPLVQPLS